METLLVWNDFSSIEKHLFFALKTTFLSIYEVFPNRAFNLYQISSYGSSKRRRIDPSREMSESTDKEYRKPIYFHQSQR